MNLNQFAYDGILKNGCSTLIRAIRPGDNQKLIDAFYRLTSESRYFRFFGHKHKLSEEEAKYLTEVDFDVHVAIVATVKSNHQEEIIGVGRYHQHKNENSERVAEFSIAVNDDHQNLGVGTLLFKQLVSLAKKQNIFIMEADILLGNKGMLKIVDRSCYQYEQITGYGLTHVVIKIK